MYRTTTLKYNITMAYQIPEAAKFSISNSQSKGSFPFLSIYPKSQSLIVINFSGLLIIEMENHTQVVLTEKE